MNVRYTDKEIEKMFYELEDATMIEKENGELVLASDFYHFKAETSQRDIWSWLDENYSKGFLYLYENIEIIIKETKADCSQCNRNCIHRNCYRRLPKRG